MSFKVIDTLNNRSFTSEALDILNQVAQNLTGVVTTSLAKSGNTYTFTFTVDAVPVALTGLGGTPQEAFKNLLATVLQDKIEAELP
jgi:hypothetical protein